MKRHSDMSDKLPDENIGAAAEINQDLGSEV